MNCPGTTRSGERCRASVERGYRSCPSHRQQIEGTSPANFVACAGLTASGVRCQAGAQRGQLMCPQHADQPVGMLPATPEKETAVKSPPWSVTVGPVVSLLPGTSASGKPYTYLIVGKTEIYAFGDIQRRLTKDLFDWRVRAWWSLPGRTGGRRFLRRIEVC